MEPFLEEQALELILRPVSQMSKLASTENPTSQVIRLKGTVTTASGV